MDQSPLTEPESLSSHPDKKYWAFVSYSSKDRKWGKWLHSRLENYPILKEFQGTELFDGAVLGKDLKPCFRDRDELSGSADLGPAILKALHQSRYLIVLCSKNSAKSEWVNKEIEDFKSIGGEKNILALILDGEPNASSNPNLQDSEECFPPALRYPVEPLAGDMRKEGDGKERGFLKVLSGIAQLDFDVLYRRHERAQRKKRLLLSSIAIFVILILATLTSYAFQQRSLAEHERRISTLTLAQGDYTQAQYYRSSDDYIMAFAHLARCLQNDPENKNAADLAWAIITNENLSFPCVKSKLSDGIVDAVFSGNGKSLSWIEEDGSIYLENIAATGELTRQRRIFTFSDLGDMNARAGHKYLHLLPTGNISVKTPNGQNSLVINVSDGEYTLSPLEPQSTSINPAVLDKIGEVASRALLKTIEEKKYQQTHLRVEHPYLDEFSEIYSNANDLDSIVFAHVGGTAREHITSYITPSGEILLSQTRPVHQAYFIKELDTVLIEATDYVGATYLSNLNLGTGSYQENFYSNIHTCKWVIDPATRCIVASVQEGNHALVYDSPKGSERVLYFLSREFTGTGKKAQQSATRFLVCESPVTACSYLKQRNALAIVSNGHYHEFGLKLFSERIEPEAIASIEKDSESPGAIDTLSLNMDLTETFEILSESTHNNSLLSHMIDLNLIGGQSPITLPMPVELDTGGNNLFFVGDNFWEHSHETLLCHVDQEGSFVLNMGRFGSLHLITPATPLVRSREAGAADFFYWCPRPLDEIPTSLSEILNSLIMEELGDNNRLTPHSSSLQPDEKIIEDAYYPTSWQSLIRQLGFK